MDILFLPVQGRRRGTPRQRATALGRALYPSSVAYARTPRTRAARTWEPGGGSFPRGGSQRAIRQGFPNVNIVSVWGSRVSPLQEICQRSTDTALPFGRIIRSKTKEFDGIRSAVRAALFAPCRRLRRRKAIERRQGFPNTNAVSVGGSAHGRLLLFRTFSFALKEKVHFHFIISQNPLFVKAGFSAFLRKIRTNVCFYLDKRTNV